MTHAVWSWNLMIEIGIMNFTFNVKGSWTLRVSNRISIPFELQWPVSIISLQIKA